MSPGLLDPPMWQEKKELPDDRADCVHDTMIPDPEEKTFRKEAYYNATRLLAATVAFYVDCLFGNQCTMKEVQEKFIV